jgi:phosphomannomutase
MDFSTIFKAYDVRGIYPEQINEQAVYRIGQAYAAVRKPKKIAVGRDVRESGKNLKSQLIKALTENGVDVVDIGIITTDQLYFTVGNYGLDGGISVTASHNPGEYNGLKFAESGGRPMDSKDLEAIRDWAASGKERLSGSAGNITELEIIDEYVDHVLGYADEKDIKPLRLVANANFGAVGKGVDKIAERLGLELERLNWEENGTFPKGPPNPLLPGNRDETVALIKSSKPDLGVAWDADADRVFLFTGSGKFVPSAFIIALFVPEILRKYPGSNIVRDVTTTWPIDEAIKAAGGRAVNNRTGHTFMKRRMREVDAPFAAESSGHYYFRDSFYADNGLAPLLMVIEMISKTGKTLDELVGPLMKKYVLSGELNFTVADPARSISLIENNFTGQTDKTDGLVIETDDWRFSVRPSNTEPLFRLNAEAHDQKKLDELVKQITDLINT